MWPSFPIVGKPEQNLSFMLWCFQVFRYSFPVITHSFHASVYCLLNPLQPSLCHWHYFHQGYYEEYSVLSYAILSTVFDILGTSLILRVLHPLFLPVSSVLRWYEYSKQWLMSWLVHALPFLGIPFFLLFSAWKNLIYLSNPTLDTLLCCAALKDWISQSGPFVTVLTLAEDLSPSWVCKIIF